MEKQVYITEEERAKCKRVVDALWQEWECSSHSNISMMNLSIFSIFR